MQDEAENTIGSVDELMLNTDAEMVNQILLDNGDEYPVESIRIGDGVVYLLGNGRAAAGGLRDEEVRVQRVEEELVAGTREQKIGQIRVRKEVHTDHEQISVPKRHEEVYVERVPVDQEAPEAEIGEDEVVMPVAEEEVVVEKRPVVKEEIRLHKDVVEEEETVEGEVRKEEIDVEDEINRNEE